MNALPKRIGGTHAIYHAQVIGVAENRSRCLVSFSEGETRRTVLIESTCGFINYVHPPIGGQVRQVRRSERGWVLVDAQPEPVDLSPEKGAGA